MTLSDFFIATGGFVLGFLFCAMIVIAWSGEIGTILPPDDRGE